MDGVAELAGKVVESHGREKEMLVQVLLDVQEALGWLPREALDEVSRLLRLPVTRVYQAATYYKAFSLAPRGRHSVKVCLGTACHVRGARRVVDRLEADLGIGCGGTTRDLKFTLEAVNCVGCCALGPMVMVDDDYHGQVAGDRVSALLSKYQ